jgi:uncharacterized repeat protein (TIGR01451 family)
MPAFSLVSWLKQQLDGPAWKHRRRRHFFRPQLTVLEDRVAPASFTVNTFADTNVKDFTNGTDSTGHVSLRSAIQTANHLGGSNTISLPAGTYDLSLGQLSLKNNLTLTGAGASNTKINAQYTSRIFQISSGFTVAISKVTMEEGGVLGAAGGLAAGGAIFDSGVLTLTNDTLSQNIVHGGDGADGGPGTNGIDGTSTTTPPTSGGPGGDGQRGGDAKGGAIYLDNSVGAGLSIVNCAITNNIAFQGSGGSGGQGGTGGNQGAYVNAGTTGGQGGDGGSGGQGGNAFGGAVYNAGGALFIQESMFSGNFAGLSSFLFGTVAGGGIGGAGGSGGSGGVMASGLGGFGGNGGNGGFAGADLGGAIYNSSSGSVTITASSFAQNGAIGESGGQAGAGGSGAANSGGGGAGGTGGSSGDGSGGAIDNQGTMTIDNSSLFQNQATGTNGGPGGAGGTGGDGTGGSPGNRGGNGGNGGVGGVGFAGSIESFSGSLTLKHSTLSLNSAGPGAGGVGGAGGAGGTGSPKGMSGNPGSTGAAGDARNGGIQSVNAKTQLFDTIVAGDTAPVNPDVNGHFLSLGHNLIGNATGSSGFNAPGDQVGTTAHPINPALSAPGNHGGPTPTMVPIIGSPAIDAGDNANTPATDQRGLPRIVDGDSNVDHDGSVIDIGAVEFQPTDVSITAKGSPGSVSLGGTITYTITVSTGGGDNAVTKLALSDSVPAQTTIESFAAPAGWIVTAPAVGHTGTVTASFVFMGPKTTASFTLVVKVGTSAAGTIANTATITTTSPQPTSAGKTATVTTTVTHGASVGMLVGPLSLTSSAASSSTDLAVANAATVLAVQNAAPVTVHSETFLAWAPRTPAALGRKLHLMTDFWSELDEAGLQ